MTETRLVKDIMTPITQVIAPTDTVVEAAKLMAEQHVGTILVGEQDRLVGILTDRDIAVRMVAEQRDYECTVQDVMSNGIKYIYEDEPIEDVARNIENLRIRRFPVLNRKKRLTGIVSLGDLARDGSTMLAGEALCHASRDS